MFTHGTRLTRINHEQNLIVTLALVILAKLQPVPLALMHLLESIGHVVSIDFFSILELEKIITTVSCHVD